MAQTGYKQENTSHKSFARTVFSCALGVVCGYLLGYGALEYYHYAPYQIPKSVESVTSSALFARSAPVELRIPKIELATTFESPLGLAEDQTIQVPKSYTKVGWYKHGATPGEIGPAVVLGHVDTFEGPAVFYDLQELNEGDEIFIKRADGTTAVFEVVELVEYSRDVFPTERVYGKTDTATLRLITCSGTFNRGEQIYSHNLVVYASLVADVR